MTRVYTNWLLLSIVILVFFIGINPSPLFAADNFASFRDVTGEVLLMRQGSLPAVRAKSGDMLSSGDIVRTKKDSSAEVLFKDGARIKVSPNSRVDMGQYYEGQNKNRVNMKLSRGKVAALVPQSAGRQFEVQTPNAICGVRGTGWEQAYHPYSNSTTLSVTEGSVYTYNLSNPENIVTVRAGSFTTINGRSAPNPPNLGTAPSSGIPIPLYTGASESSSASIAVGSLGEALESVPSPPPPPPLPYVVPVTPTEPTTQQSGTGVIITPAFN